MKTVVLRWVLVMFFAIAVQAANKTAVELLLGQTSAKAGSTVTAGLRMRPETGWKTYWRNGGDSGFKTEVEWTLPAGVTVGEFQWPVPEKMTITQLDSYVYGSEIILPFIVSLAPSTVTGPLTIKGKVSWLECSADQCVPADAEVSASLMIADESMPSDNAAAIEQALKLIPKPDPTVDATAEWSGTPQGNKRELLIKWKPRGRVEKPDFFAYESDLYSVAPQTKLLKSSADLVQLKTIVTIQEGKWPDKIKGLALDQTGQTPKAVEVTLEPRESAISDKTAGTKTSPNNESPPTLLFVLLLAFVGGMILNIMPCVLPVVALKILSFVNQSREEPGRVRILGLIYGAGVLASFLVLAIVVVLVQRGGNQAAWGMQMQNPVFVLVLITVLLLASLNLFGVFELVLGGRAMGTASALASREGPSGAFFNGVFTTLLATPCTAPALGVALGFAYTQPPLILVLILLTVGLGLALPYVVLCFIPAWLKFLPKPGAWMDRFKKAMAFPLLGTLAWLLWVAIALLGSDASGWIGIYLVALSLAAWIYGDFIQRGTKRQGLAWGVCVATLAFAVIYVLEYKLHWRNPPETAESGSSTSGYVDWQPWSPEAVGEAREAGHVVFVDFTARWCVTCQSNKKAAIETEEFRAKLKEVNGVAFKADFTRRSPEILKELSKYGKVGVPLNLVFSPDLSRSAIILPPNLLFKADYVLETLENARKK